MAEISKLDRFRGCLLGLAIGDAVGAPFEGLTSRIIYEEFDSCDDIVAKPPVDCLYYTDDTQMMIGVAETLVEHGCIDYETLCRCFVENYDPSRGYGAGTRKILEKALEGDDARELAESSFPGGSYGNGAAMRVAPVGLLFANNPEKMAEQAGLSSVPTHTHPLAIEGAVLLAAAIGHCIVEPMFSPDKFWQTLKSIAKEEEYQWSLSVASELGPDDSPVTLGNSLEAHRSVVTAIACFSKYPDDYSKVIARAISLGNDTDTLAAMAGAISGAYLGIQAIPKHLMDMFEVNVKGLDYIDGLADQLYTMYMNQGKV